MQAPHSTPRGTAEGPSAGWLSAHLFLRSTEPRTNVARTDRVLRDLVLPALREVVAQGWVRRFFFIRYHELGPHLRVRLQGDPEVLARRVLPRLAASWELASHPVSDAAGERFDSALELVSNVRWIPYEPELERYGGAAGVELAEELFHASSEAAFDLLGAPQPLEESTRSLQALFAIAVLAQAFCPDRGRAGALARSYGEGGLRLLPAADPEERDAAARWLRIFALRAESQPRSLAERLDAWWQAMEDGEELPPPFARYHARLRAGAGALRALHAAGRLRFHGSSPATYDEAVSRAAPSYLHMMSNRLGITVVEEAFLGHYLAWELAASTAAVTEGLEEVTACSR